MAYLQRGSWRYRLTGNPRRIECFDVDEATSRFTISLRAQKENEAQQTTSRALDVEPIQIPVDPSEELSFRRAWGCLGSITLNEGSPLRATSFALRKPRLTPQTATLVLFITEASIAGSLALEDSTTARIARINDVGFVSLTANQDPLGPSPVDGLKKLLTNGNFYFAVEESTQVKQALYESEYDAQFVWNRYLTTAFASTTTLPALRRVLQGHFAASTYFTERGEHATMTLLSRLSSARAGTRLRTRGVDDDGNVANFCEVPTLSSASHYLQTEPFHRLARCCRYRRRLSVLRRFVAACPSFGKRRRQRPSQPRLPSHDHRSHPCQHFRSISKRSRAGSIRRSSSTSCPIEATRPL